MSFITDLFTPNLNKATFDGVLLIIISLLWFIYLRVLIGVYAKITPFINNINKLFAVIGVFGLFLVFGVSALEDISNKIFATTQSTLISFGIIFVLLIIVFYYIVPKFSKKKTGYTF